MASYSTDSNARSGLSSKERFWADERKRFEDEKNQIAEEPSVGTRALSLKSYNYTNAVNYARKNVLEDKLPRGSGTWGSFEYAGNGDCTNFVSICMYNGGIPMDYKGNDETKWFYDSMGTPGKTRSYTWPSQSWPNKRCSLVLCLRN